MIKLIAAIDSKRGLANDQGIPWQGKIPTDVKNFRQKTAHSVVLMGWVTYTEFSQPLSDRKNFVLSHADSKLRAGFDIVTDLQEFLRPFIDDKFTDLWIIGGAGLFEKTIAVADELFITQLATDFSCTKFFPEFEQDFILSDRSDQITENGIGFRFEVWKRHAPQGKS